MSTLLVLLISTVNTLPTPLDARVDGPRDFWSLSVASARELTGERRKFHVWLSSPADVFIGRLYESWSSDRVYRTVKFREGAKVDEEADGLTVEGYLRIIAWDDCWEMRIEDAVMVGRVR